jgi:uncharacterized protein
MSQGGLAQFAGEKYLSLETLRKSGKEVRTPVWFVENNGMLYVRTAKDTGKYKRILNNKSVRIVPCDMRGKVKGEWTGAEANVAQEDEARQAYQLLEKKYGLIYKMARAFLGGKDYVIIAVKV